MACNKRKEMHRENRVLFKHHFRKAYRMRGVKADTVLNLTLHGGDWSVPHFGCFREQKPSIPFKRKAAMFRAWGQKISVSVENQNRTFQITVRDYFNPLKPELNPICYLLALLGAHHFLHFSRIRVKLLTLRLLMSYIYIYIYIWSTHS